MCINVTNMKKSYILVLFSAMLMLSGCDFFRKVAGRPTSEDIEAKKVEIARVEKEREELAREQARQDSINAVMEQIRLAEEKAAKDSLDALATLKNKRCKVHWISGLKGLDHRYYFVVGSFKESGNANRFISRLSKYPEMKPVKVRLRSGMYAVAVCPRDKVTEVPAVVDKVRAKQFCPKEAWVLVNEQ